MTCFIIKTLRRSCIIQKNSAQQELSFDNVGNTTLVAFERASPLAVELDDIVVCCRLISSLL